MVENHEKLILIYGKIDGNIVVMQNDDIREAQAVPNELMGSEAYSMYKRKDALNRWNFGIDRDVDFLTVSTDGLRNAFGEDDDDSLFHSAIKALYAYAVKYGVQKMLWSLPQFLSRCSNDASADDVTLCCFVRKEEIIRNVSDNSE